MLAYMTVSEKADHSAQMSNVEILVPHCSTLCNCEVRITIA